MSKQNKQITLTNRDSKSKLASIVGRKRTKDPNIDYGRITVELPESLIKRIKKYCIDEDLQLNEYIKYLVEKDLPKEDSK